MRDDFAERFRVLCAARGLRPKEIARRAKVDPSRVTRWLDGTNKPRRIDVAVKRVLQMSLAEFYSADLVFERAQRKRAEAHLA